MKRRDFIKAASASLLSLQVPIAMAQSASDPSKNKKVVWVLLRGALDPLHTVIPHGDHYLSTHRKQVLSSIKDNMLPLNSMFSMHPQLPFFHELYQDKQLSPIVAVASGYRKRSHFEAQDQMESGLNVTEHDSGWLARALEQYKGNGVAISRSIPIAMRGAQTPINTWYPSSFEEVSADFMSGMLEMYEDDSELYESLQQAIVQKQNPSMQMQEKRRPNFAFLAQRCGELMNNDQDANCGMLEMGGWDTHNNMESRLSRQFEQLNLGLQNLKNALKDSWQDTLVIISSEFGRTVRLNGTGGTDHGTGGVMFLAGGSLQSMPQLSAGSVLGQWPTLNPNALYENRDLMPTSDVRKWITLALLSHWQLSSSQLHEVFPDII